MRLDRCVAERAPCSRKEALEHVRRGRVTVAGVVAKDPSQAVGDEPVELQGRPLVKAPLLVGYHKPIGVQCTVGDPLGRLSLQETVGQWLRLGLHPVGRLDADSEGLLLLSRDGSLTQKLLHPKHGVQKVYDATVEGDIQPDLGSRLSAGIETAIGTFTAELIAVDGQIVRLRVHEGKHRMVRRMLNNAGHPVVRLVRREMGEWVLGGLAVGQTTVLAP